MIEQTLKQFEFRESQCAFKCQLQYYLFFIYLFCFWLGLFPLLVPSSMCSSATTATQMDQMAEAPRHSGSALGLACCCSAANRKPLRRRLKPDCLNTFVFNLTSNQNVGLFSGHPASNKNYRSTGYREIKTFLIFIDTFFGTPCRS